MLQLSPTDRDPPPATIAPAPARARAVPAEPEAPPHPLRVALAVPGWVALRFWRGELPVWLALALTWAVGASAWWGIDRVWMTLPQDTPPMLHSGLLLAEVALRTALVLGLAIGLLRCARHRLVGSSHLGESQAGPVELVVVGLLLAAAGPLLFAHGREAVITQCHVAEQWRDQQSGKAAAGLSVNAQGRELHLDGPIDRGLARRVAQALDAAPQVRTLVLSSPGGLAIEGEALAALVLARGLDTRVDGECSSACLLAFTAGRTRWMGPQARFGAHRSGHACITRWEDPDAVSSTDRRMASFLLERGVSGWFVERMLATPFDSLWVPTAAEAYVAGLGVPVRR
jgi:hypothetical protein